MICIDVSPMAMGSSSKCTAQFVLEGVKLVFVFHQHHHQGLGRRRLGRRRMKWIRQKMKWIKKAKVSRPCRRGLASWLRRLDKKGNDLRCSYFYLKMIQIACVSVCVICTANSDVRILQPLRSVSQHQTVISQATVSLNVNCITNCITKLYHQNQS